MLTEFKLTDEDLKALYEASKPVPYMVFGGTTPRSPQQNANDAWQKIGDSMGFYSLTVVPVPGKGHHYFMAEPKPKMAEVEQNKEQS